jgi:hypothetical protein
VKPIKTGRMLATVDFNRFRVGRTATRAAGRHLKREPLLEKVMLPVGRNCPDWGRHRSAEIDANDHCGCSLI